MKDMAMRLILNNKFKHFYNKNNEYNLILFFIF